MKIISERFLIRKGEFSISNEFSCILKDINAAISCVSWHDNEKFMINPQRKANGVFPIKNNFVKYLQEKGWLSEIKMSLAIGMNPGPIDVVKQTSTLPFAVEWETGNISSSHRALNKVAVGILQKQIIGGILILPTRNLSRFLTDRVGNYEEISPYFPMYEKLAIKEGVIGVIAIEHDNTDNNSPIIPKGKDGNAQKGKLFL